MVTEYVDDIKMLEENHDLCQSLKGDRIKLAKYAVYAAEQVIDIYERRFPLDTEPRLAIDLVKTYIEFQDTDAWEDLKIVKYYMRCNMFANAAFEAAGVLTTLSPENSARKAERAAMNAARNLKVFRKILDYGKSL
jgi:hypothetical protein